MATVGERVAEVVEQPSSVEPDAAPRFSLRLTDRRVLIAAVIVVWIVGGVALQGRWTLDLAAAELNGLHRWLNEVNDSISASRATNPVFTYFFEPIRVVVGDLATFVQQLIAQPAGDRPVPMIGWLGVVAVVTFAAGALGNLRVAVLAGVGFTFLGLQGLWQESMDSLALTLSAVLLALIIGVPIGIAAGVSNRANAVVTPVLDVMQVLPAFVYLLPLTLFFLLGPASAVIVTLIYAMPPTIRFTAFGIRSCPPATVEAASSLGSTGWQRLFKVQLPMARPAIVSGLNQTIMAALAMVTIAALISAPGLGQTVLKALQSLDVGTAFNGGLAIVVMAVVLDRVTTAASRRTENARRARSAAAARWRRPLLVAGAVATLFAVYLSRTYLWAAEFPSTLATGGAGTDIEIGSDISRVTTDATVWVTTNFSGFTNGFKDLVTSVLLDNLQALLSQSPWWLVAAAIIALAFLIGDARAAITAAVCLAFLVVSGVWTDSMVTLSATLVATVAVVVLGVVLGVWMGRNGRVDAAIRPLLDAAQTMPGFVYLVPFLALFAASRFTAIIAAVVYATPIAVKVVADGVRAVPVTAVESATAAGSTSWQTITKVQLPMIRPALALAVNQGLIYVLAMVVLGGLVGGGALGYDVVSGFSQNQLFGKGLTAGLAIVALGIMLDRITQAAAQKARA